ncbi:Ger(x)C family spore germination protein [Cohnella yongneupensis]|uniref:Ger(X)C family spore germination protein n=1 Tax=Cohnella yongneupensis TaxID=425006 RepID=A0ABW0R098_9BACL
MRAFLISAFCSLVFLAGCANQRVLDSIQLVQGLGYDLQNGKVAGAVIYPNFEEKGKVKLYMLKTLADSHEEVLTRLSTKVPNPIETGQLRMIIFGEAFARQGIGNLLTNFSRISEIGSRTQLAVAEGTAEMIMKASTEVNIPFHLNSKITQLIKFGDLPKMNLHIFLENLASEGRDPYTAYYTIERGQIKVDGLALFRKAKFVDKISMKQTFLLKMLMEGTQNGEYQMKIKENDKEGYVLLKNLKGRPRYCLQQTDGSPSFSIALSMKAQIKALPPWFRMTENKDTIRLEKLIDERLREDLENLLDFLRKENVDPIGFGDKVRAKSRNWDLNRFQALYPHMKTTVRAKVKIIQTGIVE